MDERRRAAVHLLDSRFELIRFDLVHQRPICYRQGGGRASEVTNLGAQRTAWVFSRGRNRLWSLDELVERTSL
jgi:hypothetical protein